MSYFSMLETIATKEIFPGYTGRFVHTANQTFAFWDVAQEAQYPSTSTRMSKPLQCVKNNFN
ncbi:hypothetical protein BH11BAC6_BH11BAC6_09630 [soil metagenome]